MVIARIFVAICALLIAQITAGQASSSSLSGVVTDPDGAPFANMPIRAVNEATGTDARTFSSESGRYEIRDLPAGTYVVSIAPPCCSFIPYSNDGVTLVDGAAHDLDIQINETLVALGDDPGTIGAQMRDRQVIPDLPVPHEQRLASRTCRAYGCSLPIRFRNRQRRCPGPKRFPSSGLPTIYWITHT